MKKILIMGFIVLAVSCSSLLPLPPSRTEVPSQTPTPIFTVTSSDTATESPPSATPTLSEDDRRREEYAVYNIILEQMYIHGRITCIVLEDHTTIGYLDLEDDRVMENLRDAFPEATDEIWSEFIARNKESILLTPEFQVGVPVILISEAEILEIFSDGGNGWQRFYETYPGAQGIMELSRAGFSPEMDRALVYVGNQSDFLAGAGYILWMEKQDGAWEIGESLMVWIS